MNNQNLVEYFLLKNAKLERSLSTLQKSGIDIGYSPPNLTPIIDIDLFPYKIWAQSEKMAEYYKIYFSMENSIRQMIKTVLLEKYGFDWLKKIPPKIHEKALSFKKEEEEAGMEVSQEILEYMDFGDLITILESNKREFDNIGNMTQAKHLLSSFIKSRNMIAHCRLLTEDEQTRFFTLVKTWLRMTS